MILFFKRLLRRLGLLKPKIKPYRLPNDDRDLIEKACAFIDANPNTPVYLVCRRLATFDLIRKRYPGVWPWLSDENGPRGYVEGYITCVSMNYAATGWRCRDYDAHLFVLSRMRRTSPLTRQLEHRLPNRENVHIEYSR
jgi:hypothetical protein